MLLTEQDFDTHLYPELIDAIKRDDANKLTDAIKAAEAEAKSYLNLYNISQLFSAQGDNRDDMLLMYLKDLAVWHFIIIANPNINIEFHQMRYEYAIKELGKIQAGKKTPYGWPEADKPEGSNGNSFIQVGSNPRRETRF
jgi:hypothetical protein